MKVKDVIKQKDYSYVECRAKLTSGSNNGIFIGTCEVEDGVLYPKLGEVPVMLDDEVLYYEEWHDTNMGDCVTIVTDWMHN